MNTTGHNNATKRKTTEGGAPIAQNNNWGIQAAYFHLLRETLFWIAALEAVHSRHIF
jgi:hypothetical protein